MRPPKKFSKFQCCTHLFQRYGVTLTIQPSDFVCTTPKYANFFMGHIHVHILKPLYKRITFFHCTIVSEVHAQYPQDTHFDLHQKSFKLLILKWGAHLLFVTITMHLKLLLQTQQIPRQFAQNFGGRICKNVTRCDPPPSSQQQIK